MRDRVVDTTVRLRFTTNDGDGAPIAPSSAFAASDFRVYKDGSATQKTSTNGITVTSPFDSVVGRHLIEIDTSNDTDDAGFWALGSEYSVEVNSAKTVDGVSQSGVIVGEFRLVSGAVELDSTRQQALADLAAMITGSGTADAKFDTVALSNAPGGGGLTGPFTRTITVTDAADDSPIEAAKVRLYRTGETETKPTEADGQVEFTTEAATFSYAVTANGYSGASGTIVISANGATTIEMTATSVTPPTNPALSAVVVSCLGTDFEPEAGVTIDLRIKTLPSGSTNTAYPGIKQTATSNGSGIATLEAPKGSVCEWKRGKEDSWTEITIGSGDQTNVTSIIGSRY